MSLGKINKYAYCRRGTSGIKKSFVDIF